MTARTTARGNARARGAATIAVGLAASLVLVGCADDAGTGTDPGNPTDPADGNATAWEPDGDIEWIVPYSPGGGFDTYSRGLSQVMQQAGFLPSGVNVVIRNTTPLPQGITQMFMANADGYTVGILPMPAAIAQEIENPDVARWETERFTVLGSVDENAYVVYVPDASPFETIEDLIAADGLRTITVEQGSSSALAGLATIGALDLDATITYGAEGSSEVVTAALRGDADFFVYGASDVVGFIDSGDVRPLLFLGTEDQRSAELPWLQDVPSAEDIGYPDLAGTVTELRLIVAPPDLPDEVADYLRTAVGDALVSDEFRAWAEQAERPIVPRDWQSATGAMEDQIAQMQTLLPALADIG